MGERARKGPDAEAVVARQGLGAAIRRLRQKRKLSQQALAERAGMSGSWLSRVEAGAVEVRWGSLRKIAYGLDVTLPELLEEAERMEPNDSEV